MKRIIIVLCLAVGSHWASGQRSYQFESPDRLFYEGKAFFELRDYPGCVDKLEAFKAQSTDGVLIQEADYMMACIAFEQGRTTSTDVLQRFLSTYPDSRHRNEICFLTGSALFELGDYPSAIRWLNESDAGALGASQRDDYAFRIAYSMLQTGDLAGARYHFTPLQQSTAYHSSAAYGLAYIDYAEKNYDSALGAFTKLKNSPEHGERALYFITQIYFINGQYEKVTGSGEELLKSYPDNADNTEIYRLLGNAYYHQGDRTKATEMLEKYVESTDQPLRGDLYLLGICYYHADSFGKAVDALSKTVDDTDELTQNAYLYLGQSYLKLNDKNNARMAFEWAATSAYDKHVQEVALYNYALLIHETSFSGFGESVSIFEDFLNDFPNSQYADKVNDHLTEVYMSTKNYESALASIEKIRRPGAQILAAKQNLLFQLGAQAFTNQTPERAIEYFSQAIALKGYDAEAYAGACFWRAESYYRLNNFAQAAQDYQTYIDSAKDRYSPETYALAHYDLGYCHFRKKTYPQALRAFRQYTALEKNTSELSLADAYNRIGDCLFYDRQYAAAEENYTRAASLQPGSGDYALYQKGLVMGLQKDYQGKIAMLDRLIREYPESPYADDALYEKGRSYVLLEMFDKAAESFTRLIAGFPQNSLARKSGLQLGLLYFNNNQSEKAIEAYKQVIADYPGSEETKIALQDLKTVYADMNDVAGYAAYVRTLGENVRFEVSEQDSLTYFAAERLFLRGDNEGARRSLRNYVASFTNGAFNLDANYYLGQIAFIQKEYAEATQRFSSVLNYGNTKFSEEALARKSEIEYLEKNYAAAMGSFKRLLETAESAENIEAARLGILRCAQQTGLHDEALKAAGDLLKNAKLSPEVAAEARLSRAKAYLAKREADKAAADLATLSKDTRTVYGAEAKFLLAQSYFDKNDYDKAEKELTDFIRKGTSHQYWLARAFVLLSDVYIRKDDDFQARQYLLNLQKNYKGKDDIAGMIEERLDKLNK
ncbi:MAG: tetratricopeptide repeat protein [Tannerella sp.]|jgi:TolA-binding protein|nr:tetratricopeptide repeat protein [Tannerella sp.]